MQARSAMTSYAGTGPARTNGAGEHGVAPGSEHAPAAPQQAQRSLAERACPMFASRDLEPPRNVPTTPTALRGGLFNVIRYEHADGALPHEIKYEYVHRRLPAAGLSLALRRLRHNRRNPALLLVVQARASARSGETRCAWFIPIGQRRALSQVAADEMPYLRQLCGFCAIVAPDVRPLADPHEIEIELGIDRQRDQLREDRRRAGNHKPRGGPIIVAVHDELRQVCRDAFSLDDATTRVQRFLVDHTALRVKGRVVRAYLQSCGAGEPARPAQDRRAESNVVPIRQGSRAA